MDLAAVGESLLVTDAVCAALRLEPGAAPSDGRALVDQLRRCSLLIVLDNCEHLLAACAQLVGEVLAGCPRVDVLATSREPLHAQGSTPSGCRRWRCRRPFPPFGPTSPRWADFRPCACSSSERGRSGRASRSTPTTPGGGRPVPTAGRDAAGAGVGRGPNGRPGARRDRAAAGRRPVRARWGAEAASPGTRPCGRPWNGATTCSPSASRSCCADCRCSPVASLSPRWRRSAAIPRWSGPTAGPIGHPGGQVPGGRREDGRRVQISTVGDGPAVRQRQPRPGGRNRTIGGRALRSLPRLRGRPQPRTGNRGGHRKAEAARRRTRQPAGRAAMVVRPRSRVRVAAGRKPLAILVRPRPRGRGRPLGRTCTGRGSRPDPGPARRP